MQVVVYEFLTGGGLYRRPEWGEADSLLREGKAMLAAVAADLAEAGCRVCVLRDRRFADLPLPGCEVFEVSRAGQDRDLLRELSPRAEWTLLVAPETDGTLGELCRWVQQCGGRLAGCPAEFVDLAADKHRMAEHLRAVGAPAPEGLALEPGEPLPEGFPFPAVLKPRASCGSDGVRFVPHQQSAALLGPVSGASRLERFCAGTPASIALLCGPAGSTILPPCRQVLSQDGSFAYLGGQFPLDPALAARAEQLARRALPALAGARGFIGLDIVLGECREGSDDVVIEVNPRLTTSYIGLRAACGQNLAAAMLAVAGGLPAALEFGEALLTFSADGQIAPAAAHLDVELPAQRTL